MPESLCKSIVTQSVVGFSRPPEEIRTAGVRLEKSELETTVLAKGECALYIKLLLPCVGARLLRRCVVGCRRGVGDAAALGLSAPALRPPALRLELPSLRYGRWRCVAAAVAALRRPSLQLLAAAAPCLSAPRTARATRGSASRAWLRKEAPMHRKCIP